MKTAAAIITNRGGRTSHAAIVSARVGDSGHRRLQRRHARAPERQEGRPAAPRVRSAASIPAKPRFDVHTVDVNHHAPPHAHRDEHRQPRTGFQAGGDLTTVGWRMGFIFANWVQVHPLALTHDTLERRCAKSTRSRRAMPTRPSSLSTSWRRASARWLPAFYPKPVILRLSDFQDQRVRPSSAAPSFEQRRENPAIGWRGEPLLSPDYREGFVLGWSRPSSACEFRLTNLLVMVPFCRTPGRGASGAGSRWPRRLKRGRGRLRVYVMAGSRPTHPGRPILGTLRRLSVESNDPTQLTLGVDRDSTQIAALFSRAQRQRAAFVRPAHRDGAHCSGARSASAARRRRTIPEFAAFLVEHGIDSASLIPDAILRTTARRAGDRGRGLSRRRQPRPLVSSDERPLPVSAIAGIIQNQGTLVVTTLVVRSAQTTKVVTTVWNIPGDSE